MLPVQSKLTLELLFGSPEEAGAVVTWVLAHRGDRVVVASRHRDGAAPFLTVLRDRRRMAAYGPIDGAARKRAERLAAECRIDAVVCQPAQPADDPRVFTRVPKRAGTTATFVPNLLS